MTKYIVKVDRNGNRRWYNESNKLHRVDGPAIEWVNGTKEWYLDGKRHRENGPAIEFADGTKFWYLNGEYHRTDGPAMEFKNGWKYWYFNGVLLTESEFLKRIKKAPCEGKEVEVDGIKYKLIKA